MKLIKYKVKKFRSVQDSGWIEIDQVNAFLGENESGKTNLLLPLWKLNPSSNGKISLLADAPRGEYSEIRDLPEEQKPCFITAVFKLSLSEQNCIADIAKCPIEWVELAQISRRYDGVLNVTFPQANPPRKCSSKKIRSILQNFIKTLGAISPKKNDSALLALLNNAVSEIVEEINANPEEIDSRRLQSIIDCIESVDLIKASKTGGLIEVKEHGIDALREQLEEISADSPSAVELACEATLEMMPTFIYYSNYGNLDGQIYLPRVIEDMKRGDLAEKEAAKVRTLKVLFEFLKLQPDEILELGRELTADQLTEAKIESKAEQKRERTILLDSAGDSFTKSFTEWWRQGNYTFSFRADGDHFKIWVSDSVRTDRIELEHRSTGLQWFFRFFWFF